MPYKSSAQRRFFHSKAAAKAGISQATIKEFDKMSAGMKLPEHVRKCMSCKPQRKGKK